MDLFDISRRSIYCCTTFFFKLKYRAGHPENWLFLWEEKICIGTKYLKQFYFFENKITAAAAAAIELAYV